MQTWQWLVLAIPAVVLVVSIVMIARILMRGSATSSAPATSDAYADPGPATYADHEPATDHSGDAYAYHEPAAEADAVDPVGAVDETVTAHHADAADHTDVGVVDGHTAFARPATEAPEHALEDQPVVEASGVRPRNVAD